MRPNETSLQRLEWKLTSDYRGSLINIFIFLMIDWNDWLEINFKLLPKSQLYTRNPWFSRARFARETQGDLGSVKGSPLAGSLVGLRKAKKQTIRKSKWRPACVILVFLPGEIHDFWYSVEESFKVQGGNRIVTNATQHPGGNLGCSVVLSGHETRVCCLHRIISFLLEVSLR